MQQTMHYAITLLSFKLRENITPLNAAIQPRTAVFSADFVSCMECNSICTPVPSWLTFQPGHSQKFSIYMLSMEKRSIVFNIYKKFKLSGVLW